MQLNTIINKLGFIYYIPSPWNLEWNGEFADTPYEEKSYISLPENEYKFEGNLTLGLDFDGSLKSHPGQLKNLIKKIKDGGGKAYIISGRPPSFKPQIEQFVYIYELGPYINDIFTYPVEFDTHDKWDRAHSYFKNLEIGKWKGEKCKELKVEIMVEDMFLYAREIMKISPMTLILRPFNYGKGEIQ